MTGVYDLKGEKISEVELPPAFNTDIREDLIRRTVIAIQSHRLQAYGPNWFSGKDTSAFSFGPGRGLSRIPRITGGGPARGRGAIVPQAVGGRRAHPPVTERVLSKKINKKERILATASAVASTADRELVISRGHKIADNLELPIVVSDDLEKIEKTKDVEETLINLGLGEDLKRAKVKSMRSGKGTKRGRKYKRRKGALIVVSNPERIKKVAENISGIDVRAANKLNPLDIAPGSNPARLTIYTQGALKEIEDRFKEVL